MQRRWFLGSLAASLSALPAAAQSWPARPIRIVVPFPPGSAADAIPRGIALRLQEALGVPCVLDNRPGAAGTIGADAVAKAAPDGYTVLSHTSALTIQPHLGSTPFDLLRDLAPVTQTIAGSYVLVVGPSFPASNLREFIQVVRAAPGKYSYASYGTGSGPHLAMELLKGQARLFILHVPFRGAAPAMQELLAGRLDMAFDTSFAAVPHIRAGRLKAIALGGPGRLDALPGVGTVAELYRGFDTDGWQGFFVPAGTAGDIIQRLRDETARALGSAELAGRIKELGFQPVGNTSEQFSAVIRADYAKWGQVVRTRGIKAD